MIYPFKEWRSVVPNLVTLIVNHSESIVLSENYLEKRKFSLDFLKTRPRFTLKNYHFRDFFREDLRVKFHLKN